MNFQELGHVLRVEREKKGLTIELVMDATKISRTNIVAMENGDRATLPHPVYAKGFVKSYARYLGLDADELSMVVDREYQDEADGPEERIYEVSPAAEKAFQEADSSEIKKKRAVWPLLLVFVVLIGVVVFLVLNFKGKSGEEEVATPPAVEQVEEAAPPVPPALESAPEVSEEEAIEQSVAEEGAAEEVASEEAVAPDAEEAAVELENPESAPESKPEPKVEISSDVEEETAAKPEEQKYDHMLVIRATTEKGCWIGLWKGDEARMARDFVLKQGEPLRLMFNSPRRIRIGNVAGVVVMYNGKPYPLDDSKGNIQTLQFGM